MDKKIPSILAIGIILIIAILIGGLIWIGSEKHTKQIIMQQQTRDIQAKGVGEINPIGGDQKYEDKSSENPIDANFDLNNHENWKRQDTIRYNFTLAKRGEVNSSSEKCEELQEGIGFCVGGYAAKNNDQSICETYDFKHLYKAYPMCDCGMQRGFAGGNSVFEDCYIGYGIINKDETACEKLPEISEDKNIPQYEDDKTPAQQIKKESCLYGVAIGKNNYEICESTGFFRDSCYSDFAELKKSAEICHKISNGDFKSDCIRWVAPLSGEIEQCMYIEPQKYESGPVSYSNMKKEPYEETNDETEDRDRCIFDVVDEQKLSDREICEKIISPYYKYLCRQRVAMNLKDPTLCSIDFLGSQNNVNGCFNALSIELKDISLCNKTTRPDICREHYNK